MQQQSQQSGFLASKFDARPIARPMLSRDADSMYWLSRYVERAEHVARLMLINTGLLIDVGDLEPALLQKLWENVLQVMRAGGEPQNGDRTLAGRISRFMTFDVTNPSSILSCISRARENARAIRESISAEMWENLNALYWSVSSDDAPTRFDENPDEFYRGVMTASMLFQGLTDQTLPHDQRWHFAQVAKYFERIDITSRVLETKYELLTAAQDSLEAPIRNIHWFGVLRSCCSIEAFRRMHGQGGDLDGLRVAQFLILERSFPRSIYFCVEQAAAALREVRASAAARTVDPAERIMTRLAAQLEYAEVSEITAIGVPAYLQNIETQVSEAALAVQKAYFLN